MDMLPTAILVLLLMLARRSDLLRAVLPDFFPLLWVQCIFLTDFDCTCVNLYGCLPALSKP